MDEILQENERIDDLHRNGYRIIQNAELFCFGQDAVLLSAFARAKKGERALDLCTGNGIVPILMAAKNTCESYNALEILPQSAELAQRSVALNHLEDKIRIMQGDLREADRIYAPSSFDVITVNPPYMNENGGIVNPSEPKAIARHELLCTLGDILAVSARLLRFGGRFYMIHRPTRLADIIDQMRRSRIEPKRLRMVSPKRGKEPTMVLIEGAMGGKAFLKVLPELIIYHDDGSYTDEVMEIYYG